MDPAANEKRDVLNAKTRWIVYLVRCADGTLYCGITNNLKQRLKTHNLGKGAKYTRSRTPVTLVGTSSQMTKSDALKMEYRIKRTHAKKKRFKLQSGKVYVNMGNTQFFTEIRTELQMIAKSVNQLSDSIAAIAIAIEKLAPTDLPADLSVGNKVKRAPLRKKVLIKHGVVEQIKRVPATKIVYDIIKNSTQGIDTAALMKATGFNQRKIHNITFRLKKQGRVKSGQRGLYMKA